MPRRVLCSMAIVACGQLKSVPKVHVHLEPQNRTLCENRIFKMKLRRAKHKIIWIRVRHESTEIILITEKKDTQGHREGDVVEEAESEW